MPIFDSKLGLKLGSEPSNQELVIWSIQQLNIIANSLHESSKNVIQMEFFFHSFYALLVEYTANSGEAELKQKINHLKQILPENWIYERESRQLFSSTNFAFDVKNQIAPEILRFSKAFLDSSPNLKKLLVKLGIEPFFSTGSLVSKLAGITKKFDTNPVDSKTIQICQNIALELIHVNQTGLDSSVSLEELRKAPSGFYLPDNSGIMRNVKNICNGKLDRHFSSIKEIYSLHPSIYGAERFGIEDSKIVFSRLIGKPFGQKELLTNRIKKILHNYSNEICLFNEMIQNADDADAKEIRFVLDRRQLSTENTFASSFNPLQGI